MADDVLQLEGDTYYSSKKAAEEAGYSRDYISRLCRNEEVKARRLGRAWFVEKESLETFKKQQEKAKKERREQLSKKLSQRFSKHSFDKSDADEKYSTETKEQEADAPAPSPYADDMIEEEEKEQTQLFAHNLAAGGVALMLAFVFGSFSIASLNTSPSPAMKAAASVSVAGNAVLSHDTRVALVEGAKDLPRRVAGGAAEVAHDVQLVARHVGPTLHENVSQERDRLGSFLSSLHTVNDTLRRILVRLGLPFDDKRTSPADSEHAAQKAGIGATFETGGSSSSSTSTEATSAASRFQTRDTSSSTPTSTVSQ